MFSPSFICGLLYTLLHAKEQEQQEKQEEQQQEETQTLSTLKRFAFSQGLYISPSSTTESHKDEIKEKQTIKALFAQKQHWCLQQAIDHVRRTMDVLSNQQHEQNQHEQNQETIITEGEKHHRHFMKDEEEEIGIPF